ncbi:UNVERIFIED_CONTAM: hypothetical protein FKN15_074777 [Acipenser sinensis]
MCLFKKIGEFCNLDCGDDHPCLPNWPEGPQLRGGDCFQINRQPENNRNRLRLRGSNQKL